MKAESDGDGRGARFTVTFPLAAPPVLLDLALSAATVDSALTDRISIAGLRVLVVEDEADAAEFVKRLLENHGAAVVIAASAREALDQIEKARADILISDIGLPEVDGYQLLEQVRSKDVSDGGSIPAIALTAFARSEDRTRALLAGYQAHLSKPIESRELIATVATFAELAIAQRSRRSFDG
jgi:CheY-like chemotaxis protein